MDELGLGEALKHEREKRNIPLDHISTKTNININALTALENEDIDGIPGPFYLKNYIKNYLHAMDADAEAFIETHKEKINAAFDETAGSSEVYCTKLKYSRFKRKKNVFVSLILTVIVFVLVFYLIYTNKDDIFGGWNSNNREIFVPQTGIDFTAPIFKENFSSDFSPLNISIEFTDSCWIQVIRGREKTVEKTFKKGDRLKLEGYELTIYMANPAALRFTLNGKEVTYLQKKSGPEKLIITPAGIEEILKK